MSDLPSFLTSGERARLFPVLADTSREGRTLSIVLACLQNVDEFGRAMLSSVGRRLGVRSTIETFTEVVLNKQPADQSFRPDGLVMVKTGSSVWSALVEAKVGNSVLTAQQLTSYLNLAKLNGIDAVITLSNQFAPLPTHHPVQLPSSTTRKAELFHWSWMFILTEADLLIGAKKVADNDQRLVLKEMLRFLTHPSAGVKTFDQMPASWSALCSSVLAGASIPANSSEAKEVVGAWHQEVKDLSLTLSRQLETDVDIKVSRAHAADPQARERSDTETLSKEMCLRTTFEVPAAASPMDVCADLAKRSVSVSMKLRAPLDKKGSRARVNWLTRQLQKTHAPGIYVRLGWPGRALPTQYDLESLRENPDLASEDRAKLVPHSFEVVLVRDLAGRFAQRRNFITELESVVPQFYEQVGQHLKEWVATAPKIKEGKTDAESVSPEALREEAEAGASEEQTQSSAMPSTPSE